jgi:hypothetical protein
MRRLDPGRQSTPGGSSRDSTPIPPPGSSRDSTPIPPPGSSRDMSPDPTPEIPSTRPRTGLAGDSFTGFAAPDPMQDGMAVAFSNSILGRGLLAA